jgi:hypothetical protein
MMFLTAKDDDGDATNHVLYGGWRVFGYKNEEKSQTKVANGLEIMLYVASFSVP